MVNPEIPTKISNSKITEALELLNEAAKEKREEMKGLMTDRYSHIKQVVLEGTTQGKKILDKAQDVAQEAIVEGRETVKKTAVEVDRRVRKNPWPYVSGAAVVSLILGYFMGSKRK
jgi:ElaB/YqjD/DUF883 family membrane-anchored ribosome-binding protein